MTPKAPISLARPLASTGLVLAAAIAATIVIGWTGDSAGRAVAHSRRSASYPGLTQPAAVTGAEQARVLRYWTAARMAAARPPGVSQAGAVTAPEPGPHRSSVNRRASVNRHASARLAATDRPGPARVRATTSAADWPGGGTIVRTTGKVFFTMEAALGSGRPTGRLFPPTRTAAVPTAPGPRATTSSRANGAKRATRTTTSRS